MMNSSAMARSAYSRAATIAPSLQDVEYRAFGEVTRRLKEADDGSAASFPALAEAVHLNQKLWGLLAIDVALPENGLPEALRAQLFYLYEFTRTHSRKVLSGQADTSALVEINTAIMKGLRGDTAPPEPTA